MKRLILFLIIPLMLFADWPIWGNLNVKDTTKLDGVDFIVNDSDQMKLLDTLKNVYVDDITYSDSYWDDLRFPSTRLRQGALQKPDFDYDRVGLLFPQNNTNERTTSSGQFPHSRKDSSDIHPHIHYDQTSSDTAIFKLRYRWYDNRNLVKATDWDTVTTTSLAFTYVSDTLRQIASFEVIEGDSIFGASSMIDLILYRDDNAVTGDVLVKELDIHFQIDSPGSRTEFVK